MYQSGAGAAANRGIDGRDPASSEAGDLPAYTGLHPLMASAIRASLDSLARRWSSLRAARAEAAAARRVLGRRRPGRAREPLLGRAAARAPRDQPARHRRPEPLADGVVRRPLRRRSPLPLRSLGRLRHGPARARRRRQGHLRAVEGVDFSPRGDRRGAPRRRGGGPRPPRSTTGSRTSTRSACPPAATTSSSSTARCTTSATSSACSSRCAQRSSRAASSCSTSTWGRRARSGRTRTGRFARSAFDALPRRAEEPPRARRSRCRWTIPRVDPVERDPARAVRRLFEVLEDRPYGGNILWFVFPCLDMARLREDDDRGAVAADRARGPPARKGLGRVLLPGDRGAEGRLRLGRRARLSRSRVLLTAN